MPRESAEVKARRILGEGRVVLVEVRKSVVWAKVRGSGAVHDTGFAAGAWTCSCPNHYGTCSHIKALKLVTAPDIRDRR
jgi:hypothetical protein